MPQMQAIVMDAALNQPEIQVNLRTLYQSPEASLTGLLVLSELRDEPISKGLHQLVALIEDGRLKQHKEIKSLGNRQHRSANNLSSEILLMKLI